MKFLAGILIFVLAAASQAQSLDTRWQLRVLDLKHDVKVDATIRFTGSAATESCMRGSWKRIIVEAKAMQDERFFPLAGSLAYILENGHLTVGRVSVCDGYAFLSGGSDASAIHGSYYSLSIDGSHELGYFSLQKIR